MDTYSKALETRDKLDQISKTFCMAKWLQVSIHLPTGLTQSCYHPPTHKIPLHELERNHSALHNTSVKVHERKIMRAGGRPEGCEYCWSIEDAPDGPHLSDRHYRSGEDWVDGEIWDRIAAGELDRTVNPAYVEVNFNQACNFKCVYCSPHLSTEWEAEIEQYGPILLQGEHDHNNIESLKRAEKYPLGGKQSENPYVTAFWEWWPELYPTLKVFRMTGGEPLMDKNTFKVLEYVNENPSSDLQLSITSNMCPPSQALFDRFVSLVNDIEVERHWNDGNKINPFSNNHSFYGPACKHIMVFVSLDTVGSHAEYIRTGLNYDRLVGNVHKLMSETKSVAVSFINTFNIMSIPRLKDFFALMLDLRRKYPGRIQFDVPFLQYPNWISAQNANTDPGLLKLLDDCIPYMEENKTTADLIGFEEHEIAKLKRNIGWIKSCELNKYEYQHRQNDFLRYFKELDRRRGTNFEATFPEMAVWYQQCKDAHFEKYGC